jgi:sugar/nucleoside kinase (ribokinase family)
MSEAASSKSSEPCKDTLRTILEVCRKNGNCTMELRAAVWLRHSGEKMDITPANFHFALADWLGNAGFVKPDQVEAVAAFDAPDPDHAPAALNPDQAAAATAIAAATAQGGFAQLQHAGQIALDHAVVPREVGQDPPL